MDKMNRSIRRLFFISLMLSVGFPAGVLCIVFGAIKNIVPLLVLGIILAVLGFYVMPLLWIKFGEKRKYRTILIFIEQEHIYTVQGLSAQSGYSEKKIREILNYLVLANYLMGYLIHGDTIELNTNKKQTGKNVETKKCPNCGGRMSFDGLRFVCDYCSNVEKR